MNISKTVEPSLIMQYTACRSYEQKRINFKKRIVEPTYHHIAGSNLTLTNHNAVGYFPSSRRMGHHLATQHGGIFTTTPSPFLFAKR
jgi:hypothetical protein